MLSQESASASEEVAVAPQQDKEEEEEEVSEALDLTNSSAVTLATEGEANKEAGNISKGSGMKDDVVLDSRDWDSDAAGGIPGPASDDEEDIVLSDEDDEGPGESMAEHRSSSSKERTRLTDSPRRAKNSTASSSTASSALWGAAATGAASDAASQGKPWELSQDGSDDFDLDSALAELEHIRSRAKTALSESRRFTDGSAAPSKRSAAAASLWDISPSRPMVKGRRGRGSSSSSAGAGALPQRDDDSDTPEDIVLEGEVEGEGSSYDDSRGSAHGRRRATGEGAREVISVEDSDEGGEGGSDDSFFPFDEESDEEPPRHYGELDFNSPHQFQPGAQQGNSGGRQSIPDAFGWDDVPRQAQGGKEQLLCALEPTTSTPMQQIPGCLFSFPWQPLSVLGSVMPRAMRFSLIMKANSLARERNKHRQLLVAKVPGSGGGCSEKRRRVQGKGNLLVEEGRAAAGGAEGAVAVVPSPPAGRGPAALRLLPARGLLDPLRTALSFLLQHAVMRCCNLLPL